jgi:dihydrofolate reductase
MEPSSKNGLKRTNEKLSHSTKRRLSGAPSHKLRNLDELKKVKAEKGSDIVLWGSSTLYPQLLDANLIDRLLLLTVPIVLGKGKRIFGNTSHQVAMKLTKCEATPTGVIMATYERAGAVPTGSL